MEKTTSSKNKFNKLTKEKTYYFLYLKVRGKHDLNNLLDFNKMYIKKVSEDYKILELTADRNKVLPSLNLDRVKKKCDNIYQATGVEPFIYELKFNCPAE